MTKVLMISRDVKVLESGSAAFKRMQEYKKIFDDLEIVVVRGNIFSFLKAFTTAGRLARRIGKGSFVTSQDPFESGIIAFVTAKLFGLKLQFQLHTDCFEPAYRNHSIANALRVLFAHVLIPHADSLRVVSQKIAESVVQKRLCSEEKIFVLPIFTDVEEIRQKTPTFSLRGKYPEFKKIVLVVARLEKEKNITLALSAFQKMTRMEEGLLLVIAGAGKEEKWLREYARHLGISESVRFEGWVEDTISLFKSADLLLVTSFYEGYGLGIIEALALGCPVVSTDVGIAEDAGAVVTGFDAGEIALQALDIVKNGKRGELDLRFSITKEKYLEEYKKTFV
ncbi:MAG: glycosyltransferase [Candidatus Paceibacterota bacterium]|jgi:glycosyltransferase involved in cell wall biosynthesis